MYGGTCWMTSLHNFRIPLQLDADLAMPFVPQAIVVYLSLFPMTWLAPFVLRSRKQLATFARALAVLIVCCGVGFLLIPSEEVRSMPAVDGWVGPVFGFADDVNLSFNNLPSLHVGMAVVCAYFYSLGKSGLARTNVWLWAIAIGISTLLTHQHYITDVVAGVGVAVLICRHTPSRRLLPGMEVADSA
ncbi:MAG: phosphatase PAP2 family protein [Planctomycetota bacterium]